MFKKIITLFIILVFIFTNVVASSATSKKYPLLIVNESISRNSTNTGKINLDMKGSFTHDLNLLNIDPEKYKDKALVNKTDSVPSVSYSIDDTRTFYTSNISNNTTEKISAKLYYSGTHVNVWVGDNNITKDNAKELGKEFDNNIYNNVITNFAYPSDVDKDGKINILCYDIKDGYPRNNSYISGYFSSLDLYNFKESNKSEILHIDTYPSMYSNTHGFNIDKVCPTLIHEFQHMVSYNQSIFVEKKSNSLPTWIDEGLSMSAEQMYTKKSLDYRINSYNYSWGIQSGNISLLNWTYNNTNDVLGNYALSYLFMQYLKIQCNQGDRIFKELQNGKYNDYRDIETLIKKYIDRNLTFNKFMTDFRIALVLRQSKGLYGFKDEDIFNKEIKSQYCPMKKNATSVNFNLEGGSAVLIEVDDGFSLPKYIPSNIKIISLKDGVPKELSSNDKLPYIKFKTINRIILAGTKFDKLYGVYAYDGNGNKIYNKITVKGSVNSNKTGIYALNYYTTDSKGNKSLTRTRKITVVRKSTKYKNKYYYYHNGIRYYVSNLK